MSAQGWAYGNWFTGYTTFMGPEEREELAWAAGFFDGEGSFHRQKHAGGSRPAISVTQVDRRVLDRLCSALGVGKVYGPYKVKGTNHQPRYNYRVTGWDDYEIAVSRLGEWLSPVKKEQALRVWLPREERQGYSRKPKRNPPAWKMSPVPLPMPAIEPPRWTESYPPSEPELARSEHQA